MADHAPDPDDAVEDVADPSQELWLVEKDLADLRQEAEDLRRQIGDPGSDPGVYEDRANLLVSLETHEDLIERFETRAQTLRQQLDQA